MTEEANAVPAATEAPKKTKKLAKIIADGILTIKESITNSTLTFDPKELSDEIKKNLMYHGLSQKLGDAAAGREGKDAVEAINKVWEGLKKGDFTIRVPAAETVKVSDIVKNYNAMPEGKEKKATYEMLVKFGLLKAEAPKA